MTHACMLLTLKFKYTMHLEYIIIIFEKVGNARLRESDTLYQSEGPRPTNPTHGEKEEKEKTVEDRKQGIEHWLCF